MRIEEFQSGNYRQQYQYRSFNPTYINHEWTWEDAAVNSLLAEANRWVGELNAYSKILPDVNLYIKMHVLKEANASSRIEGTQTSMETAALPLEEIDPEGRDDWQEVQNYVAAMNNGVDRLENLSLSNRLLKEAHAILLRGVRGEHKTPGEFRKSQNWIGGSNLTDAAFIPPHQDEVPELMSDLEKFWHNDRIEVPHLIRIALSHYQFETIHPFQDGNGRIGRLLITLYLMSHGLLTKPCLYVSSFLEKNRASYYDALTAVRTRHDLLNWVKFFLNAINVTANEAVETFRKIVELKEEMQQLVFSMGGRATNGARLLELFYSHPGLSTRFAAKQLNLTPATIDRLLREFIRLGIVHEITGYRRNRIFFFKPYFDLFI